MLKTVYEMAHKYWKYVRSILTIVNGTRVVITYSVITCRSGHVNLTKLLDFSTIDNYYLLS